jgi:hypothetical protein
LPSLAKKKTLSARRLLSGVVEDLGKNPVLSYGGGQAAIRADSYAVPRRMRWQQRATSAAMRFALTTRPYRVVHGGDEFRAPARIADAVIAAMERWEKQRRCNNTPAIDVIRHLQHSRITHPDSRLHAMVIHSDEALMIAHEAVNFLVSREAARPRPPE